jgi:fructosamine-3-kinase
LLKDFELLLLAFIEPQAPNIIFGNAFGRQLAAMHQANEHSSFGWQHDNYLGNLAQHNKWNNELIPFWVNQRIRSRFKKGHKQRLLSKKDIAAFDGLLSRLTDISPILELTLIMGFFGVVIL